MAVTSIFLPACLTAEILKLEIDWIESCATDLHCPRLGHFDWNEGDKDSELACSDTNEADEALSSRSIASTAEPSGAVTSTRQVMNRVRDFSFTAAFDET